MPAILSQLEVLLPKYYDDVLLYQERRKATPPRMPKQGEACQQRQQHPIRRATLLQKARLLVLNRLKRC